jgi:hypothetical protein
MKVGEWEGATNQASKQLQSLRSIETTKKPYVFYLRGFSTRRDALGLHIPALLRPYKFLPGGHTFARQLIPVMGGCGQVHFVMEVVCAVSEHE